MKVNEGQTLYAPNSIEVEVTEVRESRVQYVTAIRKSDGWKYFFQIVDGVQMHYVSDSYFDDDSGGKYKPQSFFRETKK